MIHRVDRTGSAQERLPRQGRASGRPHGKNRSYWQRGRFQGHCGMLSLAFFWFAALSSTGEIVVSTHQTYRGCKAVQTRYLSIPGIRVTDCLPNEGSLKHEKP